MRAEGAIGQENVLGLNSWYMQGMWLSRVSKELVPLHFYSSLFCSYYIHPNSSCSSWSQSGCQLPRLPTSQVTYREDRMPVSETSQQESWALWWPAWNQSLRLEKDAALKPGTSQPITEIKYMDSKKIYIYMDSSFWLRLIRAMKLDGQSLCGCCTKEEKWAGYWNADLMIHSRTFWAML